MGPNYTVELIGTDLNNRFEFLSNRTVDVLISKPEQVLVNDVYEVRPNSPMYARIRSGVLLQLFLSIFRLSLHPSMIILQAETEMGFTFSDPYLYDGLTFAGLPQYVACADDDIKSFFECSDIMICATEDSRYLDLLSVRIPSRNMVVVPNGLVMLKAFIEGKCNVMANHVRTSMSRAMIRRSPYAHLVVNLSARDFLARHHC